MAHYSLSREQYRTLDPISRISYDTYTTIVNHLRNDNIRISESMPLREVTDSLRGFINNTDYNMNILITAINYIVRILNDADIEQELGHIKKTVGFSFSDASGFIFRVTISYGRMTNEAWNSITHFREFGKGLMV